MSTRSRLGRPLWPSGSPVARSVAAGLLVVAALSASGCASSREVARDEAVTAVRAQARAVQGAVEAAARGTSGPAQAEAVRTVVAGTMLEVAVGDDGVLVDGALSEHRFAGGGLTYEGFVARLCLRYSVAPGSGATEVEDAPCPADVDATVPADETVSLE
ncbi:hypothetical protein [Jannaschia sp. R86511]|uniref:hypothetical protein n=1 Tax=Jannaschia sp. R86511 TaxID=3093853 RepID=UPI0036D318C6